MKKRLRKDVDAHVWKIAMRYCLESKEYIRLSVAEGICINWRIISAFTPSCGRFRRFGIAFP